MDQTPDPGGPFRDPNDPRFRSTKPIPPPLPPRPPPPAPTSRRPRRYRSTFQLSIGRVLKQSFSVYFRNLHWFLLLALLVYLPIFVAGGIFYSKPREFPAAPLFQNAVSVADLLLFQNILTATMVWWVVEHLRGAKVSIGSSLHTSLGRIVPVFGLALLSGLLIGLGFLLLLVPGIILIIMFYVAIPALMIERIGPITALKRSIALTAGNRWIIFVLLLILGFAGMMFAGLLVVPVALTAGKDSGPALGFWLGQGLGLFTRTFGAVLPAVVYQEFRVGKEGGDIDSIVAVFD